MYKWITGDSLNDYSKSARTWRAHTATMEFTAAFKDIEHRFAHDNDIRAEQIEEFMIAEAVATGVMTKKAVRVNKNPNKWEKHMAPWYTAECKAAKQKYVRCRKAHGSASPPARQAFKEYRRCCAQNRAKL
jgi:hypothetical protein